MHIYPAYKELKDRGLKFLTTDQNSPIKSYTVKLSDDLQFLTRFLSNPNKGFMDEYAKKFWWKKHNFRLQYKSQVTVHSIQTWFNKRIY